MSSRRKKWRVIPRGAGPEYTFQSKKKAYEYVATVRGWMREDSETPDGSVPTTGVTVWVDEGSGWERYESFKAGDE